MQQRLLPRCSVTACPATRDTVHSFGRESSISDIQENLLAPRRGVALSQHVRNVAETRLGRDLAAVRVHDDNAATVAVQSMPAAAVTIGQHMAFSPGLYPPTNANAWSLLTHELVHTLQQPIVAAEQHAGELHVVPAEDASEREAHRIAARPGQPISQPTPHLTVHRALPLGAGAAPGVGPGMDLIFIIKGSESDEFTRAVTTYVQTVLEGQRYEVVDGLDGMFATLGELARQGQRVRRIRLVSHGHVTEGRFSGAVALVPPGEREKRWFTPADVNAYARRPAVNEIIHAVMEPGALVEFWGCNIGGDPTAGQAWATLFQSEFRATPEKFKTKFVRFALPALAGQRGRTAEELDREEGVPLIDEHGKYVAGSWILATSSREVLARGDDAVENFDSFLIDTYWELWKNGDIDQRDRNYEEALTFMRDLFDRSDGDIRRIVVEGARSHRQVGPGDRKLWASMWKTFQPVPLTDVAKGSAAEMAMPPKPARPEPVVGTASAAPPAHRLVQPAEPPSPPPPTTKPAQHPQVRVQPTPHSQLGEPRTPRAVTSPSETDWERMHPAGAVEDLGGGRWLVWNFAVGGAVLKPEHDSALAKLAAVVAASRETSVEVAGHASSSGSVPYNQQLSEDRAGAVMHRLQLAGVPHVTARGVGRLSPVDSAPGPVAMARNRSVEVRLSTVARTPLPAPRTDSPTKWGSSGEVHETDPRGLAYYLPGFSIEGKFVMSIPGSPVLLGTDWLLVGEVEAGLKLEFTTKVPITVALALKEGKWDWQLKEDLRRELEISASPKKASVKFLGIPTKPEFELSIAELFKEPAKMKEEVAEHPWAVFKVATAKFTLSPLAWESEEAQLGQRIPALAGIGVKLKFTPKVLLSLSPSPALIARLVAPIVGRLGAAAPYVGGALAGVALAILSLYLIDAAHKRGERWAQVVNFRAGYAWRLAAEAADWLPGRGIGSSWSWDQARQVMIQTRLQAEELRWMRRPSDAMTFETTYKQLYEGWDEASRALRLLRLAQYDAAMQALRLRFGHDVYKLEKAIQERIGGASEEPIGPPADLTLIR